MAEKAIDKPNSVAILASAVVYAELSPFSRRLFEPPAATLLFFIIA